MDLNATNDFFLDVCGGELLWDLQAIDTAYPEFSSCLQNTLLTWAPCGFLWITSPFYIFFMYKRTKSYPLPISILNCLKGILSFMLSCLIVILLVLQEHNGPGCRQGAILPPSAYIAFGLKFATFWLTIVLQQVQRRLGVKTSAIPFAFWFLVFLTEGLAVYSYVSKLDHCAEDIVFYIFFALVVIQLGLHCFAESYSQRGYESLDELKPWAEENASILNRTVYHWYTSVVWSVHKKRFVPEQFWSPAERMKCGNLAPLLEKAWDHEVTKCNEKRIDIHKDMRSRISSNILYSVDEDQAFLSEKSPILNSSTRKDRRMKPNLAMALVRVFWWDWTETTIYRIIAEILWLIEPIALRFIITLAEDKTAAPAWQGYFFCCMLFVALCISSCFYHMSYHHMQAVGLKVKTALMCLIYKKALTMKRSGSQDSTVGEIVNLMSVDCQRIQDSLTFSFYAVVTVFTFGIALIQLWTLMGVASVGGIGIILAMLPVVGYISTIQFKLQKDMLYLKGKRIKILNEVIGGIKVLKMYAWELSFIKKIQGIRNEELNRLMKYARLSAITVVFAVHSPFMILFTLVLIHVLTSPTHTLRAEETFTALSIINIIKFPITICPFLVNGAVQAKVSLKRITEFLCQTDLEPSHSLQDERTGRKPVVSIENGSFTWDKSGPLATLSGVNFNINKGELVAIVGPVGSGKSSLIAACLDEMETLSGSVKLNGSVAYVPQEAWIQNMTLRDNILFGKGYQESKYRKVIEACALLPDLQILTGGDRTEIGEKGINISGGQKQRVNLARAVYNNADIYFMDDPLSAVDSHVGKHLFQKVIGRDGLLKNKTRILVTHGIHWLPMVDRIIVMNDGRISESGTFNELLDLGGAFSELIHSYLQETNDDEEEDPEILRMRQQIQAEVELKSDGGMTSEDDVMSQSGRHRRLKKSIKHSLQRSNKSISRRSVTDVKKRESSAETSRLTGDETANEGAIKPTVLLNFMRAMGLPTVIFVIIAMFIFQGLNVYSNFWLTYWTENTILLNTSLAGTQDYEDTFLYYLLGFALQGIIQGIFVYASFYMALTRMVRASGKLHNSMLESVLHSPMSFFDTTPIGRIMNRFSSDVDIMDNKLPESFRLWQIMIFSTIAVVAVVTISTPIFIAVLFPIIVIYVFFVRFYLPTARQMRRTESIRRSPIYNHFSETITGASVIRAYKCSARFIEESRRRIDENIKFYYAANTGARWVGWRLELMGNFVAFLAALFALLSDLNGAQVGMSITYAVQLTITLNFGVFAISEMEMNIISAERVSEYTSLPEEASWDAGERSVTPGWPEAGKIEFRGYKIRYRAGLDLVLRGIHFTIKNGEKIGIVGRTGAGKSSLALALFRLIEAADGQIIIDGVDISTLGLHELRRKLTILPQDPVLFSGSLRNNLDPFNVYNDESIWFAIECAHLKDFVLNQESMLEYECGESGQNLSVGQRQLVCLARTLLHKTKVLILDEATAAVDMETDDLIQETIRTQFSDCTVLAVAHRLNTIMDYDRVMVLDKGMVAEFDSPTVLLGNTDGIFHGMAKDAGLV